MNAKTENRTQQNHSLLRKFNNISFYKINKNHLILSRRDLHLPISIVACSIKTPHHQSYSVITSHSALRIFQEPDIGISRINRALTGFNRIVCIMELFSILANSPSAVSSHLDRKST